MALVIAFVLPFLILWSGLTSNADRMYALSMTSVRIIRQILGVRVRVEGLENIPSTACVFMSNHVSNMDPLALFPSIPRRLSVLAKKELFRIPILGFGMRQAKFVPLDRSDRKAAIESLNAAVRFLHEGLSFVVFPEGTRSLDGRLGPFKKGAFRMTIEAGVPIVPVSLAGTQHLLPKGEWAVRPGDVTVRFDPPVDTSKYDVDHRGELLERVHTVVAENLPADQQPLSDFSAPADSAVD
jgi:1-acyl-sn-glycerol-3-phosphate acyltransferase